MMPEIALRIPVLALLLLVLTSTTHAHTRSISTSQWFIENQRVLLTFSIRAYEVDRLALLEGAGELNELLVKHLQPRIHVSADNQQCNPAGEPRSLASQEGFLRVEWRFDCEQPGIIRIANDAFYEVAPSHTHFAQVSSGNSGPQEYIFNDRERTHTIAGSLVDASPIATLKRYISLGIEHILSGLDHLAFVVALLLTCRRPREIVLLISGFTVGHSISLTLSALEWVAVHLPVIEALIGFSIALVALEAMLSRTKSAGECHKAAISVALLLSSLAVVAGFMNAQIPLPVLAGLVLFSLGYLSLASHTSIIVYMRPIVTSLFGLIHGFGFATVLGEVGLPEGRMLAGLLGFNLGVEIGQLAVVLVLLSAAVIYHRIFPAISPTRRHLGVDFICAALCCVGMYWFVSRGWVVA